MSYTAALSDDSIAPHTREELANIALEYANAVAEYIYEQRVLEDMCARHLAWISIDKQTHVIEDRRAECESIKSQLVNKARYIGTQQFTNR